MSLTANPRVNQSFDKVNLKRLKHMIVEQLCGLASGPCRYSGEDMRTVHVRVAMQFELHAAAG